MEFIDINLKAIEKLECKSLAFVSLLFIKLRRRHKRLVCDQIISLTPTFLRRSPTMFSADMRADGVSGELPYPE